MNIRYIELGITDCPYVDFDYIDRFMFNVSFVSSYLSSQVRKLKLESNNNIKMIYARISDINKCVMDDNNLNVYMNVDPQIIRQYNASDSVEERCEIYLSLLEQAYHYAGCYYDIPIDDLLSLHDKFRQDGYKNIKLYKRLWYKPLDLSLQFVGDFGMFDFNLKLQVYERKTGKIIVDSSIFRSAPDELCFHKDLKRFYIQDSSVYINNFLDKAFLCIPIEPLMEGVVDIKYFDNNSFTSYEQRKMSYDNTIRKITW